MNKMGRSKPFEKKCYQLLLTNASENKDKVEQSVLCFNFPSFELTHRTKSHLNIYAFLRGYNIKCFTVLRFLKSVSSYKFLFSSSWLVPTGALMVRVCYLRSAPTFLIFTHWFFLWFFNDILGTWPGWPWWSWFMFLIFIVWVFSFFLHLTIILLVKWEWLFCNWSVENESFPKIWNLEILVEENNHWNG